MDGRIKRNGNYLKNPYLNGKDGHPETIEGEEDKVVNPEALGAPFTISHNKGSVSFKFV